MPSPEDIKRYVENWQGEIDGAFQYRAMAASEKRANVADLYSRLAAVEEKHAAFWEKRSARAGREAGAAPAELAGADARVGWRDASARRHVLQTVATGEYAKRNVYVAQPETHGTEMTEEERMHARLLENLLTKTKTGVEGATLGRLEGRHKAGGGNALRAAVLGANDGLCSNLSLVMGIAGATIDHRVIVMTGLAGLLAGSFSMALGEWVSVTSARELAEREMRIEKSEVEENPEEEREELQLIYESKGLSVGEAKHLFDEADERPEDRSGRALARRARD